MRTVSLLGSTVMALASCAVASNRPEVEVAIVPSSYIVAGRATESAAEAVAAVLALSPERINVVACSMMRTQRITDFIAQLRASAYRGAISMNVAEKEAKECPSA